MLSQHLYTFLPSTSWLTCPLLGCPCCYSRKRNTAHCTTADTQSRTKQRKVNQGGLPGSVHILLRGSASGNSSISCMTTDCVLSSSPHSKEQHLNLGERGGTLRPLGSLLRELQSTRSGVHHTPCGCLLLGAMEEGTEADTETNT